MTDDAPTPAPSTEPAATRRRRFPLTWSALVGSAIAVPLYIGWTATSGGEPAIDAAEPERSTVAAPSAELAGEEASAMADRPEAAEPAPPPAEPEPSSEAVAAFDDGVVAKASASAPASPPPPGVKMKASRRSAGAEGKMGKKGGWAGADKMPSGGLGLVGTGRGGGGVGSGSIGLGGPSGGDGAGFRAKAAAPVDAEVAAGGEGDDTAQISAGQLTAGIIDDLKDVKLLDELRAKAIRSASGLDQAIPDHKARGAAPEPGHSAPGVLEIGFVLDTTGSMGDELQYLKAEIRSIAEEISREYPGVAQRYALVAYRDHSDEYIVRSHDFEQLDAFVDHLGAERANGGGDFPEAMEEAMTAAGGLQWSRGDAARMIFLVADAPPHGYGFGEYAKATGALARQEVSVYPVASSGVDPLCEYLMRWAARTTGGKYLFLTDHSGIGNAHAAPTVDQYEMKALRAHMLDVIRDELGAVDGVAPASQVAAAASDCATCTSWFDRHGIFVIVLGGVFLLGFAGDMTLAQARRRRGA